MRAIVLNDRMRVLTMDTGAEVQVRAHVGRVLKGVEREAPTVKGREKGYVWGVRKQGGWVGEGRVGEGREGRGVMHNIREGKDGEQGSVLGSIVGLRGWRMESRGG